MEQTIRRIFSFLLSLSMLAQLSGIGIHTSALSSASSETRPEPAGPSSFPFSAPAQEQEQSHTRPASSAIVEIRDADDLAAAVAAQQNGQTWIIHEGIYNLTEKHLEQYASWDAPGHGGWYFPLHADDLTLLGTGRVVITSQVESENGAWATQDFVSVWGDNITIDGVNFQCKNVPNKAVEIMGRSFTLKNATLLPVVHPDGENGEVFSGSIYFNPANPEKDVGSALIENVTLHAYISASAARQGTVAVDQVTMDATNNIWSVWGTGYGPGLVGDIFGPVAGVTYLVDPGAVLKDILDASSPYSADTKPGTTIRFSAGTYLLDAALTVDKGLVLTGEGPDVTVFQALGELPVLLQVAGGEVDLSLSGIHLKGVSGNTHNNSSAIQVGTNASPSAGQVSIKDCRFSDFTKNSITVKGGSALISDSVIHCKPYPGAAGNGIQIDLGAQAVITGNVIHGYRSQAEGWTACGVLVLRGGQITRISGNTLSACTVGIMKETYYDAPGDQTYLDPGAGKHNTFTGCASDTDFEFDLAAEILAYSGGVLTLPCDVTLRETLTIDKDLVLDGNSFTIFCASEGSAPQIAVTSGSVRLFDVTLAGFGSDGGQHTPSPILLIGSDTGAVTAHISGITIAGAEEGLSQPLTAVELRGSATVTVENCAIRDVERGIWLHHALHASPAGIALRLTDTTLEARSEALLLHGGAGPASLSVAGGHYVGGILALDTTPENSISITGGTFSSDPSAFVPSGYTVSYENGTYSVTPASPPLPPAQTPPPSPPQPEPSLPETSDPVTSGDSTTVTTQITPSVSGNMATAEIDAPAMDQAVESVLNAAWESGTAPVLEVIVSSEDAAGVEIRLPVSSLDALGKHESASLTVISDVAQVVLDSAAITAVAQQAASGQLTLAVTPADPSDLNDKQQAAAGEASVFELRLHSGGEEISHFGQGQAVVSLPHTLPDGQDGSGVIVYYLDEEGGLFPRPSSYDSATKQVRFSTGRFSKYLVGHDEHLPFTDVPESAYYRQAVLWAVRQGVVLGTSPTSFSPTVSITRAQAAALLWRVAGCPTPEHTEPSFMDVSESSPYYSAILWAAQQGIISGTSESAFQPDRPCTRAQFVTLFWRWRGKPSGARAFEDLDPGAYYYPAVRWAVEQGLVTGTSESTFHPSAPCTRAQAVTLLFRLLGR